MHRHTHEHGFSQMQRFCGILLNVLEFRLSHICVLQLVLKAILKLQCQLSIPTV